MEKFDDSGQADGAAIRAARMPRGEKQESRTQTFSATAEEIRGDFRNGRKSRFTLPCKLLFDQNEVIADQLKNLFDRQQGDGVSPELTLFVETRSRNFHRPIKAEKTSKVFCGRGGKFVWR